MSRQIAALWHAITKFKRRYENHVKSFRQELFQGDSELRSNPALKTAFIFLV